MSSAVQLARQLGSAALVAQAGAELAVAEVEAGQPEAARLALDRAAAAAPPDDLRARAHVVYAEARIAQAAGNLDRAESELRTAIRLLEEVGDPVVLAESYVALARLLVAQGRPDDAAPLYERAFATRGAVPAAHELPSG